MLHTSVVKYGEDGDPVDTVRKTIADLPAYSFQLAGLPHLFYLRDLPKYLYSRFPRGLSFFCYLASVIVRLFPRFPRGISFFSYLLPRFPRGLSFFAYLASFIVTSAVFLRIIFLCVLIRRLYLLPRFPRGKYLYLRD